MADGDARLTRYAALFDGLSGAYDQSGVPFFGVIARGLVDAAASCAGERVLDIGAGRGAATFPLAAAVGEQGRVDTVDLAPGMVRRLTEDAAQLGRCTSAWATPPTRGRPRRRTTPIVSSLVIFFLDDPAARSTRWRALLRPERRVGVATFQPWHGAWRRVGRSSRTSSARSPTLAATLGSTPTTGVAVLLRSAGFSEVRTELATYDDGVRRTSTSGGRGRGRPRWAVCGGGPATAHPEILRRATAILERSRAPGRSYRARGRRPLHLRRRLIT